MYCNIIHPDMYELFQKLPSMGPFGKKGFKIVMVSNKFVLMKGDRVRKGYACDEMFKLSIEINKVNDLIYLIDSYDLWHIRL